MEIVRISIMEKIGIFFIFIVLFLNIKLALLVLPMDAREANETAEVLIQTVQENTDFSSLAKIGTPVSQLDELEDPMYYAEREIASLRESSEFPDSMDAIDTEPQGVVDSAYSNGSNTSIIYTETVEDEVSPIHAFLHQEGIYFLFVVLVAIGFCVAGLQMYHITKKNSMELPSSIADISSQT